jgi:UDP-glucose 4-epimerase
MNPRVRLLLPDKSQRIDHGTHLGRVIYCAGLTSDYADRPYDSVEAHVGYLAYLIHHCDWDEFIYLSSTRLYDWTGLAEVSESTPIVLYPGIPRSLYDASKLLGESFVLNGRPGQSGKVLRLSTVVSGSAADSNFWSKWLNRHLKESNSSTAEKTILTHSAPEVSRDYILIGDVIEAILTVLECGSSGIYNVANGENTSNEQVARCIESRFSVEIKFAGGTTIVKPPRVSIAKIKSLFNFAPRGLLYMIKHL